MNTILPVAVGALSAIAGGVIFRVLEATNEQRHWFRDQMREAAERFLTDAQRHLDISRLQLVAPRPVSDVALDVHKKLRLAFNAAQMASNPFEKERWEAANAAAESASKRMADFADLVQKDLRRGFIRV